MIYIVERHTLDLFSPNSSCSAVDELAFYASLDRAVNNPEAWENIYPIADMISSWSQGRGYPILIVTRDYQTGDVILKQERYLKSEKLYQTQNWWIPYNFATTHNPNFQDTRCDGWMSRSETRKTIQSNGQWSNSDWLIFNKQQTAHYRILYDDENYRKIAFHLNYNDLNGIHPLNRAQLLDDLFEFTDSGRVEIRVLLDLLMYLRRETEYAPLVAAERGLSMLKRRFIGTRNYQVFCEFIANLTDTYFTNVGVDYSPNEDLLRTISRPIITDLACQFGNRNCLSGTHSKFRDILIHGSEISPNTKDTIIRNGARNANSAELELLWRRLINAATEEERIFYSNCIGQVNRTDLLYEYLNRTLADYPNDVSLTEPSWRRAMFWTASQNSQNGLGACIKLLRDQYEVVMHFYEIKNITSILLQMADLVVTDRIRAEVIITILYSAQYE